MLTMTNLKAAIDAAYAMSPEQITRFREDGFIKLKDVLPAEALEYYGQEVTRLTLENNRYKDTPLEERGTYGKAFIQVGNLWRRSELAKEFSFGQRLARIATQLMGTSGVRMWHDQALYKEAGGGFTPWHADQQYWPMSSSLCCTAWIPLQAIPIEMGPLMFGRGSHLKNIGRDLAISDESEALIRKEIREHGLLEVQEPFELGEVSFHYGWTLHRAGPNTTGQPRKVHTVIYMDEMMRLAEPKNLSQEKDRKAWVPDVEIGALMDGELTPVIYSTR